MRLGRACPFTSPTSDRRGASPLSVTLVGVMPSLEVTGDIRSNPSTNSTLFGQTISTGLDHLLIRPAYVSNTQACRNRNSRKKSCQLGESGRDGPWHSELQQETNKTIKKRIQHLIEEGREQVGRNHSNSPSDFAAGVEEGLGVECMFVTLVIVPHSPNHLPKLMCPAHSRIMEERKGGRKEDETEGRVNH